MDTSTSTASRIYEPIMSWHQSSAETVHEQIARHYAAIMDSVSLINSLVPTADADDLDTLDRNVLHLEQMLLNDWWTGYDLAPIIEAIITGKQ